jgi:hypothetical protein
LALEVVGRGNLFCAGDVGVCRVDDDVVLLLEQGFDLAVIRPVVGKSDDVEFTLLLRSFNQCVETAEVFSAGRRCGINVELRVIAAAANRATPARLRLRNNGTSCEHHRPAVL